MTDSESIVLEIEQYAALCVDVSRNELGVRLDYSGRSLSILDQAILSKWKGGRPTFVDTMVRSFGSYLGQVIVRVLGGSWVQDSEHWARIDGVGGSSIKVFPYAKARKRLVGGASESLFAYFESLQELVDEELKVTD